MGGCSSKPKTAEFEGAMEMHEEKPQDEAANKIVDLERIGVDAGLKDIDIKNHETSDRGIQSVILKEEDNHLRNLFAKTEKHVCAGFEAEGEFNAGRQALQDHHMNVKQLVDKEINGDISFGKQTAVKEEVPESFNNLAPAKSGLHEDLVLVEVSAPELMKADAKNSGNERLAYLKKSGVTQDQLVMSEYEMSAAQRQVSHDIGDFHLQQDELMTPGKDLYINPEKLTMLQESVSPDERDEEALQRAVNVEPQEVGFGNEEQVLDSSLRQKVQVGTVEMDCKDLYKEEVKGMVEFESEDIENGVNKQVDNPRKTNELEESKGCVITADGACAPYNHFEQRGIVALGGKSLLLEKAQRVKGDAIDVADYDICQNNYQPLGFEHNGFLEGGVHVKQLQAEVVNEAGSRRAFAASPTESHAEPVLKDHCPMENGLPKESTEELFSDESWYILEKVEVQNIDFSTVVSKESNHMDLPMNGDNISRNALKKAVICDDEDLSSSEFMVSEEKPGTQALPVMDPVGFAFQNIVPQEVPAPDIDDVLEKLASEFERQESLARSNS